MRPARAYSPQITRRARRSSPVAVQAFRRNEDGELEPVSQPREYPGEAVAIARARDLMSQCAGVVVWKRDASADDGEPGEPIVLFALGDVPDLDMPRPAEPPPARVESDELSWMGLQLPAAAEWQPFLNAFLALYREQADVELLAVFTSLWNRRVVVLPPLAAHLVARELPAYPLRACGMPPSDMVCLELGHQLQADTTWFAISDAERASRRLAAKS